MIFGKDSKDHCYGSNQIACDGSKRPRSRVAGRLCGGSAGGGGEGEEHSLLRRLGAAVLRQVSGTAEEKSGARGGRGFLSEAAAHPGISNWHVQQARDAMELYYERFRGIALEPRDAVIEANHTEPLSHERARIQNAAILYMRTDTAVKGAKTLSVQHSTSNAKVVNAGGVSVPLGFSSVQHPTPAVQAEAGDCGSPAPVSGRCDWKVLEERLRDVLRTEHYAYATEQCYIAWVKRYVAFHAWCKPSTLEAQHVHAFLKHLARDAQVASSTQNVVRDAQSKAALLARLYFVAVDALVVPWFRSGICQSAPWLRDGSPEFLGRFNPLLNHLFSVREGLLVRLPVCHTTGKFRHLGDEGFVFVTPKHDDLILRIHSPISNLYFRMTSRTCFT